MPEISRFRSRSVLRLFLLSTAYCLLSAFPEPAHAQPFSQKGFLDARGTAYPQEAENDTTQLVGEFLLRYEAAAKPWPWLKVTGGLDLRADTHDQTDDSWTLNWDDRGVQRPRLSVRRMNATVSRCPVTLELGKQFVRWGKADVLNPTDRFAPRDFLNVFDSDLLGVTGARAIVGRQTDTLDVVWVPWFTPSRTPLPGQRWAPEVEVPEGVRVVDAGRTIPNGSQVGARWNHVGSGFEFSLSGFSGYNHLAGVEARLDPSAFPPTVGAGLFYPRILTAGADAAIPLSALTLKAEAAYFGSDDARVDEYVLYVIQLERQAGEWFFVGGYAGEAIVTDRPGVSFARDRGLTKAFLGRAGYTIDTNRSVAVEGAVRQDVSGHWLRAEYSQASGQHLRVTVQGSWIRGEPDDFFGRYARNSNVTATVRYSF